MACIIVEQYHIDLCMRDLDTDEKYFVEYAYVDLVSTYSEEGYQSVALSCVLPRAYSLLTGGWDMIDRKENIYDG